ncbi:hypothetical protein AAHH86_00130 [Candidatus Hodgkinia cicadicola]
MVARSDKAEANCSRKPSLNSFELSNENAALAPAFAQNLGLKQKLIAATSSKLAELVKANKLSIVTSAKLTTDQPLTSLHL